MRRRCRRLTDRLSLWDLLERYPRRRGAANLRAVLAAKRAGRGSRETISRSCSSSSSTSTGLPRPRLNATLPVRGGCSKPDCMWPEQRLLAELDGREAHGTDEAFEGDRQRDRILLVEGWRSTRITWRQLRDERDEIAADLRDCWRCRRSGLAPLRPTAASYPLAMDRELFEHYLSDESRRGAPADGAFTGAAGGAACGDLSRISLIVEDERIAAVSFDAEGCGATMAATAAVAEMVDGAPVLEAARDRHRRRSTPRSAG